MFSAWESYDPQTIYLTSWRAETLFVNVRIGWSERHKRVSAVRPAPLGSRNLRKEIDGSGFQVWHCCQLSTLVRDIDGVMGVQRVWIN
jgi:hypothetical protein